MEVVRVTFARATTNPKSDTLSCELWAYRKDHATIFGRRDRYTLRLRRDTQHPMKLIFSGYIDEEAPLAVSNQEREGIFKDRRLFL